MHLPCNRKTCSECWPRYQAQLAAAVLPHFDVRRVLSSFLPKSPADTSPGQRHSAAYETLTRWLRRNGATWLSIPTQDGRVTLSTAFPAGIGQSVADVGSWLADQLSSMDKSQRVTCSRNITLRPSSQPLYKSLATCYDYEIGWEHIQSYPIHIVSEFDERVYFDVKESDLPWLVATFPDGRPSV